MAIKRNIRVSRLVHQIVGETLMTKMRNVDASRANIQKVEVSENLRHVKIFVTVTGDEQQRKATMLALKQAKGLSAMKLGRNRI